MLTSAERNKIEDIIDRTSVQHVLEAIASICHDKVSLLLAKRFHDDSPELEVAASWWGTAAQKIYALSELKTIQRIS